MTVIGLLIGLVIVCLVFWAARALLAAFGIGDPIATVVYVVLVVIVILWLLGGATGHLGTLRIG